VARGDSQLHQRVELMATEAEMLAVIRADPDDDQARLVYADWLSERGDERGELLVLEHADWHGSLTDRDGLRRLLNLAAVHGFLPYEPALPELAWRNEGIYPQLHDVDHDGHHYQVIYNRRRLVLEVDADPETRREYYHRVVDAFLWSPEVAYVLHRVIGEAIQLGRLDELRLPSEQAMEAHFRMRVRRDHARWCDRYERWCELNGERVDRPYAGYAEPLERYDELVD
jgi:uncharacterized protein (TIGR02996 family)